MQPIEAAIVATKGDAVARKALETGLADVLKSDAPQAAKDFVCRQLSLIGTTESIPALATLLQDEKLSHMARYALERIPDDAAVQALRMRFPRRRACARSVSSIRSAPATRRVWPPSPRCLGTRMFRSPARHERRVPLETPSVPSASDFQPKTPEPLRAAVADACLAFAEHLLADGKKTEAIAIYKVLGKPEQPKHVQVAARRGLLAAMGQK